MKCNNYYSKEEDLRFSKEVVHFNSLADGTEEKELQRTKIRDRTQILIYQLPIRNLFLNSDEASEIYLELREDVDKIISAYTISNATYNSYLTQVCRYRKLSIDKKARKLNQIEDGYKYTLEQDYQEEDLEFFQAEPHYGINRPEIFEMDMSDLVKYIIATRDPTTVKNMNKKERLLSLALRNKTNRRYMLYYLLTLPQCEGPEFIEAISRVMGLDSMVISYFYSLRFDLLARINKRWEKTKSIANKHYTSMINIVLKMAYESDQTKILKLREKLNKVSSFHKINIELAKHQKRGLTQEEAALAIGVKRSSIYYGVRSTRELLESIINAPLDCVKPVQNL